MALSRKSLEATLKGFKAHNQDLQDQADNEASTQQDRAKSAAAAKASSNDTSGLTKFLKGLGGAIGDAGKAIARPVGDVLTGQGKKALHDTGQLGSDVGQAIFTNTGKLINEGLAGGSMVGSLLQATAGAATGNKEAEKNALKNSDKNADRFLKKGGGVFGVGGVDKSAKEAGKNSGADIAKKITASGVGSAVEVAPFLIGAGEANAAAKGATAATRAAEATDEIAQAADKAKKASLLVKAGKAAGVNAALGGVSSVANQELDKGKVSAKKVFEDTLLAGGMGGVGEVAGYGFGKIKNAALDKVFSNGSKSAIEDLKNVRTNQLLKAGEEANAKDVKMLPAGEIGNSSSRVVKGEPKAPDTVPVTDKEYAQRFNEISKSYDQAIKAAESEKGPLAQRIAHDHANDTHQQMLEQLNDEFLNGKKNPAPTPGTPDKKIETGFTMPSKAQQEAVKTAKGQNAQLQQRIDQIDKIVSRAQEQGTSERSADELRALIRERRAAQDVLDGKANFDDVYGKNAQAVAKAAGGKDPIQPLPFGDKGPQVAPAEGAVRAPLDAPTPGAPLTITGKVKKNADVQDLFAGLSQARKNANVETNLTTIAIKQQAKKLGVKTDQDFMDRYMTGKLTDQKEIALGNFIKQHTDEAFKYQQMLHPDITKRENYLPGVYDQPEAAKEEALRLLKQTTGNDKRKYFNNYQEAYDVAGLTPRYKSVDALVGSNKGEALKAVEHQKVVNDAIEKGLLLPEKGAPRNWVEVSGIASPDGKRLYAQKEVADRINNALQEGTGGVSKGLRLGRKISSGLQEITLSAGIPGTTFNMYVGGQVMKDLLGAGRVSVLKDVILSSTTGMTQRRFAQKAGFIKKLTAAGADIGNVQSSLSSQGESKAANIFHALVDRPTFERYVPNTKLTVAENTYKRLIKKGVSEDEAIKIAAKTTNIFNGVVDNLAKGRSKDAQNAAGALLFAPKYREGIINTLANSVKAWSPKNIKDPSYAMSRRLAVGTLITAVLYDQANRAINGHSMFNNPRGKELTLQIPYGKQFLVEGKNSDGTPNGKFSKQQKTVNIPLFPSYLTIPRAAFNTIKAAVHGDTKEAFSAASTALSAPINVAQDVVNNQDYFGRDIYKSEDSAGTKLAKSGEYVAKQLLPGHARAAVDYAQGKPGEQALAAGLELPVNFGSIDEGSNRQRSYSSGQANSDFYKTLKPASAQKAKVSDEVTRLIKNGEVNKARRIAQEYNSTIENRFTKFFQTYGSSPEHNKDWNDGVNSLYIKTTDRALSSRAKYKN